MWERKPYLQQGGPLSIELKGSAGVQGVAGTGAGSAPKPTFPTPWSYVWHWTRSFPERKGSPCRILNYRVNGIITVQFEDGQEVDTSRYAVRFRKGSWNG